jgi:ribosomal protein L16 Arg81 hydroxylase
LIDPDLYRLTRALKLQVVSSGEVGVNCYISPTGSGFGKHFDSKAIMVVQVAGSKHWIYGKRPVVEFPQRAGQEENGQIQYGRDAYGRTEKLERAYPVGDEEFEECVLEPGDVLCLPPGTWHSACAKEFSIGLTVTFYPVNFTGVLFPLLETELRKEVPWRAGPPLIPGPAPDTPPESVRCYFRERLAELRKAIDSVDENDPRLWGAWYSGIASTTQCNQRADIHRSQSNGFIGINRAIPFCHYVVSSDGENRIVILHGPKRVTIHSTRFLSLIRALADGKIFQRCAVPTEMVDGCPPSAVDKLWDTLLEAGIAQYVERSSA